GNEAVSYDKQKSARGPWAANVQKLSAIASLQDAAERARAAPTPKRGWSRRVLVGIVALLVALTIFHVQKNHALRSAAAVERAFKERGIWVDRSTGLMWTYYDDPEAVVTKYDQLGHPQSGVSWNAAVSYCRNLQLGGFEDWRLPEIA